MVSIGGNVEIRKIPREYARYVYVVFMRLFL